MSQRPIVGVLLAAGSGSRFGGDKLLAPLPDGVPIGVAALKHLQAAVAHVVAVVRVDDDALAQALAAGGARVTACPDAALGMGESLAWGIRAAPLAFGWVVGLADMPWIAPATVAFVAEALRSGASLAAPSYRGERGHPVGFAAHCYGALIALSGDEGAKGLLAARAGELELVATNDAGSMRDVDRRDDLPPA